MDECGFKWVHNYLMNMRVGMISVVHGGVGCWFGLGREGCDGS
jgi:hypothetical protein